MDYVYDVLVLSCLANFRLDKMGDTLKVYFSIRPETTPVGGFQGRKVRKFTEDFIFFIDDKRVMIPKGFQTDCSSVPRLPLLWLIFGDEGEIAGYCHDYLYRIDSVPQVTKLYADDVFWAAMEFTKDPKRKWKRRWMYFAVVEFGAGSYHKKEVEDKLC